jgi:RNAse (barnase) inhibitor barstar
MGAETKEIAHIHRHVAQAIKIMLKKTTDGDYLWDITATADTLDEAMMLLNQANGRLKSAYGKKGKSRA